MRRFPRGSDLSCCSLSRQCDAKEARFFRPASGFGGGLLAEFGKLLLLRGERCVLFGALRLLGGGCGELLFKLHDAAAQIGIHAIDACEGCLRAALALFETGKLGDGLRGCLLRGLARFAMAGEGGFEFALLRFGGGVLGFEAGDVFALALHERSACRAGIAVALAVERPVLQAAFEALGLRFHLAQRGALVGAVAFGGAAVFALRFEQARLLGERAAERGSTGLCLSEFDFERIELLLRSRSSRLMASGPSARGLPPVTVTLWKHSPEGARKKARGFSSASERAVFASGAT